jgi:hypothetical protein
MPNCFVLKTASGGSLSPQSPDRQFGSVRDFDFSEDSIEVLFDRTFGQEQFKGDLLVGFALADQFDDLLFPETQLSIFSRRSLRPAAIDANALPFTA